MRDDLAKLKCFVPIEWRSSIVLLIAALANNILTSLSLLTWLEFFFKKKYQEKEWRPWHIELWVFFLVILLCICLLLGSPGNRPICWIAIYILFDAFGATARDVVAAPLLNRDNEGGYIRVYNKTRWLLMAVANVVQVVLCFAVIALAYGMQFDPNILEPFSAVYFSTVTFPTLGYGDILPCSPQTKALVCLELFTFLIFLAVKLPVALSVMRVKEQPY